MHEVSINPIIQSKTSPQSSLHVTVSLCRPCILQFQPLNHLTDFHEAWCQSYDIEAHVNAVATVLYGTLFVIGSVGIATDYRLDVRGTGLKFPAEPNDFSHSHGIETPSVAHPASCPIGTAGSFPGGEGAEVCSCPFTYI
jgi:hypothetical protein